MALAITGATGQVGGGILEILLKSPEKQIRTFVRSKQKLLSQRPELESLPNVTIIEGQLDEIDKLAQLIDGTKSVFLAAAAVENEPGCNVARQQAKNIVAALELLRKRDPHVRLPVIVVLSSASLERYLMKDIPEWAHSFLSKGCSYIYTDLRQAEVFMRSHEWIKQVYIKPGGLVHDEPKGHILSTEKQQTFLSFKDLAAGMVEVGEADDERWDGKNVSVLPAAPGTRIEYRVPYWMVKVQRKRFRAVNGASRRTEHTDRL